MKTFVKTAVLAVLFTSAPLNAADTASLIGLDLDRNRELVDSVMRGRNYMVQVDTQGKIKQIIDTGANGDGTDPLAASPASPASAISVRHSLPVNYQGQHAIDFLGKDLARVAESYGLTADKLKEMLQKDSSMRIDENNRIFYIDQNPGPQAPPKNNNPPQGNKKSADNNKAATPAANPPPAAAPAATLANAFLLHSKPGASKTLYLDFAGFSAVETAWSAAAISAPPYDLTGNPAEFDNSERNDIVSIWSRVAEDYLPFDVDVTTEPPAIDALVRSSAADDSYGTQVVVTQTQFDCGACGGVSYVGVVNWVNNTYYQPAWVFQDALSNKEKYIAEAISHEAGHTLGLLHDGLKSGNSQSTYYVGHGSGETGWAPIMGASYYKNLTQWDHGVYPHTNNRQDDIAVFASSGILPRDDDYGNTFATASSLTGTASGSAVNIANGGIIETAGDIDMFVINTAGGPLNLSASPAAIGPNLDIQLTLYNAAGAVVAGNAPESALSAAIEQTAVPAGAYYLAVSAAGKAAADNDPGYPVYGSLGRYDITGSYTPAGGGSNSNFADKAAKAPVATIGATTIAGTAPLAINFSANNSVGNGNISGYHWWFGDGGESDGSNPEHTYTTAGSFTARLLISNQYLLTDSKTQTITVNAATQPAVHAAALNLQSVQTADKQTQAKILIGVVDSNGNPVAGARVTGTFSGSVSGAVAGNTDGNGQVMLFLRRGFRRRMRRLYPKRASVRPIISMIRPKTVNRWRL